MTVSVTVSQSSFAKITLSILELYPLGMLFVLRLPQQAFQPLEVCIPLTDLLCALESALELCWQNLRSRRNRLSFVTFYFHYSFFLP